MGSNPTRNMEETVSWVMRLGVLLSGLLVLIGLVLMAITGDTSYPFGVPDLNWIIWGDPFLAPSHVLFLGFIVLIATPVFCIMISILMFMKMRDVPFAVITALVFLIIIISFMLEVG